MTATSLGDGQGCRGSNNEELDRFRRIRRLVNHWSRPTGPRSYYWYLTFEDSAELHSLAEHCQQAISFPYYDLTPPSGLHLTLDRIAFEDDITRKDLGAIEAAAVRACQDIAPFEITLESLGGTPSAIGFAANPERRIRHIRDRLRAATLSVYPSAPVKLSTFHPHVAIAYCNSDNDSAAEVITAVENLRTTAHARVTTDKASLVLLERRPRAYAWTALSRVPFSG